jgi:hypothetical protein
MQLVDAVLDEQIDGCHINVAVIVAMEVSIKASCFLLVLDH